MIVAPAWTIICFDSTAYVICRTIYLVFKLRGMRRVPKYYCLFEPIIAFANLFPQWAWNPTVYHLWTWKSRYEERNCEALLMVPLLYGEVTLYCASPEGLKQVLNDPFKWPKLIRALALRDVMGANVVAANGEQWRKHHKVTAPAFDNQIYYDVWAVTTRMYKQMLDSEAWRSGDQHYFKSFNTLTTRVHEATSLEAPGIIPGSDTLVLPPDVEVIVEVIAAGLNSRISNNPSAFQPQRWAAYDVSADDLLSFSYGPRGCLGRKFGTVEGVCFLTHLLREWKFGIKLENNETPSEWQDRNMKPSFEVTMRVENVPLLVTNRSDI